jgi:hypothetical protein
MVVDGQNLDVGQNIFVNADISHGHSRGSSDSRVGFLAKFRFLSAHFYFPELLIDFCRLSTRQKTPRFQIFYAASSWAGSACEILSDSKKEGRLFFSTRT